VRMPSDRALALLEKVPHAVDDVLAADIVAALHSRYAPFLESSETIALFAFTGDDAAFLEVHVGEPARPYTFEFFCERVPGALLEGALGVLVDFLDGVLAEFFRHEREAHLPLEFARRRFDDTDILVRSERREFALEAAADALLAGLELDDDGVH
jgi:hypothetical protein